MTNSRLPDWAIGPFTAPQRVLEDRALVTFTCPLSRDPVAWAAKDAFNPGAVIHDGRICLLVRGEDRIGRYAGTSRIGLATSSDGHNFELENEPVIAPGNDRWQAWEWPGGVEDPRVVQAPDGTFVCTYTAFDGKVGCLFVATSDDLRRWSKHGPAFALSPYVRRPTKAGSIVTTLEHGKLVAAKIDGKFWMYWGEGVVYAATSDDLIRWTPVETDSAPDRYLTWDPDARNGEGWWSLDFVTVPRGLLPIAGPRRHRFDSMLTEPGPPALLTDKGIVLIYNGANHYDGSGVAGTPPGAYQPGQLLLDALDPTAVIARLNEPFLQIDPAEAQGQVGNVCFAEGLVAFDGKWWLYTGLADSRLGVSTAPIRI
jgi:beta-1,2-mannosidase